MTIRATVIADSISPTDKRITTLSLMYPRFIHSEMMTHRVFSRNASSSRAIPVEKMIQRVLDDPAMPVFWGKNQRGMQAVEELSAEPQEFFPDGISGPPAHAPSPRFVAKTCWLQARDEAVKHVRALVALDLHKQIANRILEPWMHINVVCTATEWGNFFSLRIHPDAQPEMQALARAVYEAMRASVPKRLDYGEWHLPYITPEDYSRRCVGPQGLEVIKRMSAARCARVSYLNHEGKEPTWTEDMDLFDRLMGGKMKHSSPTEHQATPALYDTPDLTGNLKGWKQFRKEILGENMPIYYQEEAK